jgi:sec-independent protein translocase protein TatC
MIAYTIGIGVVFQLPLLLLLFHTIKPLTPGGLLKSEKWVVLVAFIVAAIITPTPDPINQVIIAGPVVVIYQIGVIAVLINIASEKRKQKAALRKKAPVQVQALTKEAPQKVAAQPVIAPQVAKPMAHAHQPQMTKTVDGFIVRRGAPQLQVPTRNAPMPMPRPQPRPQAQKQAQTPSKGFYVDGIIGPRQAMSL